MKNNITNLLVVLVCLGGLGYYAYKHIDWNPPKKHNITSIQVNGKPMLVSEVQAVQIPQAVYDSMAENPQWKEHLLGKQKRVLLVTWDGCPYLRAFKQELEKAFTYKYIRNAYQKDIVVTGQSVGGSCQGPLAQHCPLIWIMDHCMGGFCIVNPNTKEVIVDRSRNAQQILPLLVAYAGWTGDPLLELPAKP